MLRKSGEKFKDKSDFGWSYHSENMVNDLDLSHFQSFIEDKCFELLVSAFGFCFNFVVEVL